MSSRTQWASPARGQQCLSERGTEGWLSLTVDPAREEGWLYYPDLGAQSTTPSEHVPVPARTGEVVGQGTFLGERPALNTAEYSQRQYFVSSGRYVLGHVSSSRSVVGVLGNTASGEAHSRATCRLCLAPLVPRGTPPRAGRQSGTLNFEISNFELESEVDGKSNRRLENRARVLRSTFAYK
ncbi:hypothetical protein TIFTF001_036771 [Ficus carica]|uniref:Uncharacterized protein n=1 Tax=Ficus carica TaxID=3494 RepID=A0AA88E8P3_FICCA|nr:hypothetical protein TIFTF001_036771 [Ficus carica]